MRLGSFRYLVKQGWRNMAVNRLMTFASIGVLTACLVLTGIASLLSINVNRVVEYLGTQNEIVVYVREDASPEEAGELPQLIQAIENVDDVRYISKDDAFAQMQDWLGENGWMIDGYTTIFPASYRITVHDLDKIADTSAQLGLLPATDTVSTPTELAGVMVTVKNAVNYGGYALVGVLALVSVIIISNTIRLTVFARRREISIMKYVGATNAFIRLPFFVEGTTVGILSGLLASGAVCGAYYLVLQYIGASQGMWVMRITGSLLTLQQVWGYILVSFVVFGFLIGGLGSANSIRKHLKV